MIDNKMRRLALKNYHRPGPALLKFCTQEEREIPKAMNTKQAEKKHKNPLVSWVNWKKSNKSGEKRCGNILNFFTCAPFLSYPILKNPRVSLLATQTSSWAFFKHLKSHTLPVFDSNRWYIWPANRSWHFIVLGKRRHFSLADSTL